MGSLYMIVFSNSAAGKNFQTNSLDAQSLRAQMHTPVEHFAGPVRPFHSQVPKTSFFQK